VPYAVVGASNATVMCGATGATPGRARFAKMRDKSPHSRYFDDPRCVKNEQLPTGLAAGGFFLLAAQPKVYV